VAEVTAPAEPAVTRPMGAAEPAQFPVGGGVVEMVKIRLESSLKVSAGWATGYNLVPAIASRFPRASSR
jgi:hypothetical protein